MTVAEESPLAAVTSVGANGGPAGVTVLDGVDGGLSTMRVVATTVK